MHHGWSICSSDETKPQELWAGSLEASNTGRTLLPLTSMGQSQVRGGCFEEIPPSVFSIKKQLSLLIRISALVPVTC